MRVVLIALIGTALAYFYMTGFPGPGTNPEPDGDYLYKVEDGPAVARYKADQEIRNQVYMVLGGGAQDGGMLGEATLSAVPEKTALRLQSRYPDIGQCKSPHTNKLINRSTTFVVFSRNSSVIAKALDILEEHSRRLRSERNRARPCFRISGTTMKEKLEAKDPSTGPIKVDYGGQDYVHIDLDEIQLVKCRL